MVVRLTKKGFKNTIQTTISKIADDTVVVGLISGNEKRRPNLRNCSPGSWYQNNYVPQRVMQSANAPSDVKSQT